MDVIVQRPDGTVTYVSGTSEEIKDFFGVSDLPKSSDDTEGLEPGVYAVADGWTPDCITRGRLYKVYDDAGGGFQTVVDNGRAIFAAWDGSLHLNGDKWRKVVVE
jgi:hypothetical protein